MATHEAKADGDTKGNGKVACCTHSHVAMVRLAGDGVNDDANGSSRMRTP